MATENIVLRRATVALGLTIRDLAPLIGHKRSTLYGYSSGAREVAGPTAILLRLIADGVVTRAHLEGAAPQSAPPATWTGDGRVVHP